MERIFHLNQYCRINSDFELYYGKDFSKKLLPCKEITDKNLIIGIIDNNNLNQRRLLLTDNDRLPIDVTIPSSGEIVRLVYPGKSAFVNLGEEKSRAFVKEYVNRIFTEYDRRDHLHCTTVGEIENMGWRVFWAPRQMKKNLIHVRLVSDTTIDHNIDPGLEEATRLMNKFHREC
jgi:hypothetical protein